MWAATAAISCADWPRAREDVAARDPAPTVDSTPALPPASAAAATSLGGGVARLSSATPGPPGPPGPPPAQAPPAVGSESKGLELSTQP